MPAIKTITDNISTTKDNTTETHTSINLTISIDVHLNAVSSAAHDDVIDAYWALVDAVRTHADPYDDATMTLSDARNQSTSLIGPF